MLRNLRVQNFRAHSDYFIEFDEGVNVVVGPNASGKTSLLESIYICAQGRSFKGVGRDTIKSGEDWSRIDLVSESEITFKNQLSGGDRVDRTFIVDGKSFKRLPARLRTPIVLFEPDDLRIVSGSPQRRRDYLDSVASHVYPEHRTNITKYKKILQQRNLLLKQGALFEQFFVWDVQLVDVGEKINTARLDVVSRLSNGLQGVYRKTSRSKATISVEYMDTVGDRDYLSLLTKNISNDQRAGSTSIGVHKDDLRIVINGSIAKDVASRGEVRSLVLGLKSLEFDIINKELKTAPILLLDDVFSELDGSRRKALTSLMQNTQTVITTTDADLALDIGADCTIKPI